MYKSLKISLHLTQNCIFTNWLQKKEIVKKPFFYKRKKFDQFKEFILTNKILKLLWLKAETLEQIFSNPTGARNLT